MIKYGHVVCDGCDEAYTLEGWDCDGLPPREYLEHRAEQSGWLVRGVGHYCRTCRHAVERDSLVPKED